MESKSLWLLLMLLLGVLGPANTSVRVLAPGDGSDVRSASLAPGVRREAPDLAISLRGSARRDGGGCLALVNALRLRGGGERGRRTQDTGKLQARTAHRIDTDVMELDAEHEVEAAVKRRAQERRTGAGSALVFPSQQAVHKREEVEMDVFSQALKYHCHADKVVTEPSADEAKERKKSREMRVLHQPFRGDADDGLLGLQGVRKKAQAVQKRSSINCTLAIAHGLFNATELADFLRERIKFNNKLHNLENALQVDVADDDVVVTAFRATQMKRKRKWSRKMVLADAFSTRYLKYLMKKFIVHKELKDFVRPVSVDFSKACQEKGAGGVRFEIRYTSIHKNKHLRLKMAREHGTRMEMARRALIDADWAKVDGEKLQVPRPEMLMERKIKATGERVGGAVWLNRTRVTLAEAEEQSKDLLKHWVDLQHKTYRAPFGGAMRGWLDRSITRHDPDRVGKRSHGTAGYTASGAVRSRSGTRLGIESLIYTGTAPDGIKGVTKRAVSQRIADRAQKALYRAAKSYSRQGDADRTIYNWKPKWLMSGKMDLHKRDWR
jgi:hypothetical protein